MRLNKVTKLIDGFETPFSLELFATVDYLLKDKPDLSSFELLEGVQNWTKRKKELMKLHQINVAKERIEQFADDLL